MATAFENFALADLVKKPEDALRLLEAQGVTVTVQDTPRDAPHPITPKEDTEP